MEVLVKIEFDSMNIESGCMDLVEISSRAREDATLETAHKVQALLRPDYDCYRVVLQEGESLTMRCCFEDMPYTDCISDIVENAVQLLDSISKLLTDAGYTSFIVTPIIAAQYED